MKILHFFELRYQIRHKEMKQAAFNKACRMLGQMAKLLPTQRAGTIEEVYLEAFESLQHKWRNLNPIDLCMLDFYYCRPFLYVKNGKIEQIFRDQNMI